MLIAAGVDPDTIIGSSPEDTRLAFRRLLEARAEERPQIVVVDDLHWAEPVFVDLVEHVADYSRDAPIFLLCVARTELLELRPAWGGGKVNATSILLEPLGGDDCESLIENLLGGTSLDGDQRERITVASEGNPLFVEEMLAMVREQGGVGEIVVPPTIHALLQARLDRLGAEERLVIERGAVEGQVFHRGAVAELAPSLVSPALESHLQTLVRKELIRPDRTAFVGDDAFRFRHLLIRDAAYESLPKATRAELHERFAEWLSHLDLVERDEILGYHFEQAYRFRAELDSGDPALEHLGASAAEHLAAAGRSAVDRGDWHAGRVLFRRATRLLPKGDERRFALAPDLAETLFESGELEESGAALAEARVSSDPVTRALVAITASLQFTGPADMDASAREALREEARAVLEAVGHDHGLALYWWSLAQESWMKCRAEDAAAACERALTHIKNPSVSRSLVEAVEYRLASCYFFGPTPLVEAIRRVEEIRAGAHGVLAPVWVGGVLGRLLAARGDLDRARELTAAGRSVSRDAGLLVSSAGLCMAQGDVEFRAGNPAEMERVLREGVEELEALGDSHYLGTVAIVLAECLYRRGADDEEIEALCNAGRETTGADELLNCGWLDLVGGLVHARRGEYEEAEQCSAGAVARADASDFFPSRSFARIYLGEVLALSGRLDAAAVAAASGLEIPDAKGDVAAAARHRERLASLGIAVA
jgi:tetratricopeptide (TPR) repeat protein